MYAYLYAYAYVHTYVHKQAYLHTPIHTYMHVHTYLHKTIHKRSEVSKPCLPPPAAPRARMRPFQSQCPRAGRSPSPPPRPPPCLGPAAPLGGAGPLEMGAPARPHLRELTAPAPPDPPVSSRATVGRLRPNARLPPAVRGLLDSQRVYTSYRRCRGWTHRAPRRC